MPRYELSSASTLTATTIAFGVCFVGGLACVDSSRPRSDDVGVTWQRIDDPRHQFGWVNVLTGDPRRFGRVYVGTGGRGILYGDAR